MGEPAFPKLEAFIKRLKEVSEEWSKSAKELPNAEKEWREAQIKRETLMAELDGVSMSEEDIERVVDIQQDTNPHRMKYESLSDKVWEVV